VRPPTQRQDRLAAVDFVRGIAVLCMIALHMFDSFVAPDTRKTFYGSVTYYFGGGAAPMFLALAGLATSLAITKGPGAMLRRGVEIWLLSLLFRIQEWALGGDGAMSVMMLRVDVLNCIGLSIVITVGVYVFGRRLNAAGPTLLAAGLAVIFATPFVCKAPWLEAVPAFFRYHVGGPSAFAMFPLFPWCGVALLGAALGAYAPGERVFSAAKWLFLAYFVILAVRLITPETFAFTRSNTHPVFTLERTSLALGLIWAASLYLGKFQTGASTLVLLGRRSLLVYWVHVELSYGLLFHQWKGRFDSIRTIAATLAMILFCYVLARYAPKEALKQRKLA
jgi:uncharacterized membrane protein